MNKVKEFYSNISNEQLEEAVKEIYESEKTGSFSDNSHFREIVNGVKEITGEDYSSLMFSVVVSILKEFSFRKLELK